MDLDPYHISELQQEAHEAVHTLMPEAFVCLISHKLTTFLIPFDAIVTKTYTFISQLSQIYSNLVIN